MRIGQRKDTAKHPWRLSAKLLIASSVVTVLGFSAICASVMLDMRRGEEQLARQSLENLAATIDADIGRNIELYDLSLRAVASNMVLPEINDVSKAIRHLILFDHAATASYFGAIQVFDAEGRLKADASTLDPVPENRADEEYFQVHRYQDDVGLYISRPMLHRVLRRAEFMDRMTARVGVAAAAAARVDNGMAWYEARTRCIACGNEHLCREWLGKGTQSACEPPSFCCNAEFLRRLRRNGPQWPPH